MVTQVYPPGGPVQGPAGCYQCHHDFNPHKMVATTGDPIDGGVIICQVKGCKCFSTWAVPQAGGSRERVFVPDEIELAEIRRQMQTEEPDVLRDQAPDPAPPA